MKIKMKQVHIDKGERISAHFCPISRAVTAHLKIKMGQVATALGVTLQRRPFKKVKHFTLSKNARDFITKFDQGLPVSPIEFEITPS